MFNERAAAHRSTVALLLLSLTSLLACSGKVASTDVAGDRAAQSSGPQAKGASSEESTPPATAAFLEIGYPPSSLASDVTYIYWSELGGVYRAAKDNPVREHLFGDSTAPMKLLVDDTYLYGTDIMSGTIQTWRKADGIIEALLPAGSCARALAQDSEHLYVGSSTVTFSGCTSGEGQDGVIVISKASRKQEGVLRAGSSVVAVAVDGTTLVTFEGPLAHAPIAGWSTPPSSPGHVTSFTKRRDPRFSEGLDV